MRESPRQITPAEQRYCKAPWSCTRLVWAQMLALPPSQSKMKQSWLSMNFCLSSSVALRAAKGLSHSGMCSRLVKRQLGLVRVHTHDRWQLHCQKPCCGCVSAVAAPAASYGPEAACERTAGKLSAQDRGTGQPEPWAKPFRSAASLQIVSHADPQDWSGSLVPARIFLVSESGLSIC